jgi:hypothetical protein
MNWTVKFHDEFKVEFDELDQEVKDELLAEAKFVERFGPETGRPHVDTLQGSHYANMKELRFEASDGEWRAAFAFDPKREAIVLVAADKTGVSERKFYKRLIEKADARYEGHLATLKAEERAVTARNASSKTTKPRRS